MPRAQPKRPIRQVIAYAQSNWAALLRYTEHGDLCIDNNLADWTLRAQAIGRRYAQFPIVRSECSPTVRNARIAAVNPSI